MSFFRIHQYVHSYKFPYYDSLLENKEYLDSIYKEHAPSLPDGVNNVMWDEGPLYQFLDEWFLKILSEYYLVSPLYERSAIGIYKQDNLNNVRAIHNHVKFASLNSVLYIDPPSPEEGGGITFYFDTLEDSFTLNPLPGHAYFFPGWLFHTPEPQTSTKSRITLNWGYSSYIRPIHKISGDRW